MLGPILCRRQPDLKQLVKKILLVMFLRKLSKHNGAVAVFSE